MPLYEYQCQSCQVKFEVIESQSNQSSCPKCQSKEIKRLISCFAVGGQGDLRESTLHGCHDNYTGMENHKKHGH